MASRVGRVGLLDETGNFLVLHGDAGRGVDDEDADVGAIDGVRGAARHGAFERVLHPALLAHARRVDEKKRLALPGVGDVNRVASRTGDLADDGARLGDQCVDQR